MKKHKKKHKKFQKIKIMHIGIVSVIFGALGAFLLELLFVGNGVNGVKAAAESMLDSRQNAESSTKIAQAKGIDAEIERLKEKNRQILHYQNSQNSAESRQDSTQSKSQNPTNSTQNPQNPNALDSAKATRQRVKIDYSTKPISSEAKDYKDNFKEEIVIHRLKNDNPNRYKLTINDKPKLVIIIDDVSSPKQLSDIQKVGLKLTPSVFPSNNSQMISAVNSLPFFMVHLPLEAKQYHDELDTLNLGDSNERIESKVRFIKQNFPRVKYINNHTGSRFTESKEDMMRLLGILDKYNIDFLDSKTTINTAIPLIAQEQNRRFLFRDVFLDNDLSPAAINYQIKQGVKIAKQKGYAILIAHPHKETLQALKNAKGNILNNEVDIIYANELYGLLDTPVITQYRQRNK